MQSKVTFEALEFAKLVMYGDSDPKKPYLPRKTFVTAVVNALLDQDVFENKPLVALKFAKICINFKNFSYLSNVAKIQKKFLEKISESPKNLINLTYAKEILNLIKKDRGSASKKIVMDSFELEDNLDFALKFAIGCIKLSNDDESRFLSTVFNILLKKNALYALKFALANIKKNNVISVQIVHHAYDEFLKSNIEYAEQIVDACKQSFIQENYNIYLKHTNKLKLEIVKDAVAGDNNNNNNNNNIDDEDNAIVKN